MDAVDRMVDLGRGGVDQDHPIDPGRLAEGRHVLLDRGHARQMTLLRPAMRRLDAMDETRIEDATPRTDRLELGPQLLEELALQDLRLDRGSIDAVGKDVPDT